MNNVVEFPMAKKDKDNYVPRRFAYAGRRFDGDGKISDMFIVAGVEGGVDDPEDGRTCQYVVKRGRENFVVGQLYDIPVNENFSIRLHEAEPTDYFAGSDEIEQWSARDAAARHAKHTHGTRKRLEKEHREKWLDGMANLRLQYHQMSFAERRAMRQLVLEWLEDRPR